MSLTPVTLQPGDYETSGPPPVTLHQGDYEEAPPRPPAAAPAVPTPLVDMSKVPGAMPGTPAMNSQPHAALPAELQPGAPAPAGPVRSVLQDAAQVIPSAHDLYAIGKEVVTHPLETLVGADLPSQTAEKQALLQQGVASGSKAAQVGTEVQKFEQTPLLEPSQTKTFQKILDPKSKNLFSRVMTGGTKALEALSAPDSAELLATLPFAPEDASPLISGVFSGQMAQGATTDAYHTLQAAHRGDYGEAAERGATAFLNAAMAAASAKHAVGGEPVPAEAKPEEEKPVLHASNDVEDLRASAERQAPKIGDAAAAAAEGVPGAKVEAVRDAKDSDRIADKAERQDVQPSQIADIAAAKITVPDQAAAEQVLANLHKQMPVESVNGNVTGEPGKNGVRQVQAVVNTQTPGEPVQRAEVLIQTPEMSEAAGATHDDYRKSQELRAAGKDAEADELEARIMREHDAAEQAAQQRIGTTPDNSERKGGRGESPEQPAAAGGFASAAAEPKYKYGSTQTNIPTGSDAHTALLAAAKRIDPADLNPTSYGGDEKGLEPEPHVTVRYGVKGDDTAALEKYIRAQSPFEAKLGKTSAFPASESSDGGAVIKADVDAPELHRINTEIEKHAEFAPSNFPDYKPHATVAYVKPEAADKYVGMDETEGKTFPVRSIAITDRDGNAREIPLEGGERRANATQRQRIDEMTPQQMRQTLLTSDKTGLPNRRAFEEAQQKQPAAAVAMSDADGLKALNDRFGYDAGDALLQAKADALREAGVEAYHDKGDEFLYRGASPEELKTKLDNAREILRNRVIEAEMTDGSVHRFKGADFSYGTGTETTEAERVLKQHKADREASGERARGELRGITGVGSEEGKEGVRGAEVRSAGAEDRGRAPRPPARAEGGSAGAGTEVSSRLELAPRPPKPPTEKPTFAGGRQSTPIEVRDAEGNWQKGTLDYYNDGVNGTPRRGRVTLDNGFKMNNVADGDLRMASGEPQAEAKGVRADVGVDFDGTIAKDTGTGKLGAPIPERIASIKKMLAEGKTVEIITRRVADDPTGAKAKAIQDWLEEQGLPRLIVTDAKTAGVLYDDNAHHAPSNENTPLVEEVRAPDVRGQANEKLGEGEVSGRAEPRAPEPPATGEVGRGTESEAAGNDQRSASDETLRGNRSEVLQREQGRRQDSGGEEHPDIARERKENEARASARKSELAAARERSVHENAALHGSEIMEINGNKALVLDPDGELLWHRGLESFPKLGKMIGAGENWRGMTLDRNQAKAAIIAFDGLAQQLRADGIMDEKTIAGVERLADLVKDAQGKDGSAAILRSDFRADTSREEAAHQWMIEHDMEDSDAVHGVASRPEFRDALDQIREQGYGKRPFAEQAVELMAHVLAGDPDLRLSNAEREELARAFLTESVEEHGPEILRNLPALDPRLTDIRKEVTRGYDYGDEYAQGDEGRGVQERGSEGKRPSAPDAEGRRRGPKQTEAGAPDPGGRERRAGVSSEQGAGETPQTTGELRSPRPPSPKEAKIKEATTGPDKGPVFQRAPPTDSEEFKKWFGDSKAVGDDDKPKVVYHGTALSFDTFDPNRTGTRQASDTGDFGNAIYFADKPETADDYATSSALGRPQEWRGETLSLDEVRKLALDRDMNASEQSSAHQVLQEMKDGKTFSEAMAWAGSPALADRIGGKIVSVGEERRPAVMPVYLRAENPLVLRNNFTDLYDLALTPEERSTLTARQKEDRWMQTDPAEMTRLIRDAGYDSVHDDDYGQWAVFDPKQVKSAIGNSGAFDSENPNILFQRVKDEENPVARTVKDLVEDLKNLPKTDKGTALDRVSNWTKDTIDESLSRSGKALGGVPSAFEKAFAWAKATTAALVHDYRNPLEQTDWKTQAGQMQLSQAETALRLQDLGKALKEAAPKQLDRIAMTHWMEAAGDKAKLEEWQAGAKARAMQAMNSDIPSDRKRFLRETQAHYDQALKLTPEQQNLARRLREHFDDMLDLAKQNGLLEYGYRNYVMHLYEKADAANLLHLVDNSELNPNPSFLKRRFHDTFYSAEGDGLTPKSKDIGYLLTAYDKSMNEAIASRNFMRSLLDAKAPDGRPIAAIKTRGGWVIAKGDEAPQVLKQRARPESLEGYRDFDRPQLRNFLFKPTLDDLDGFDPKLFDEDPRSLAFKGDLIIHPKYASRVEDMLTPSWFERGEGGAQRIGNAIVKGSALAKELMTAVAPFHMVQEGVHGLEHKVNPFKLPKIDLSDKTQRLLASHGLTLTNYDAEGLFSAKALRGITEFVPGVNKAMDQMQSFSRWQFEDYIPRLKMSMAKDAFERNVKRYPNLSEEQVAELSAKQSNAAFGNLNTTFDAIPRTKTFKTLLRLATFAPDFLESRMRFVGQAFTKYGGEQRTALVRGALVMYAASRIANAVLNQGDAKWDPEHAFSVVVNGRSYSLRTVQGDILHAVTDPRGFIYNRLNPLTTRPIVEFLSGRDQMGRQKSTLSQVKDLGKSALPFGVQKVIQTPDEDWLNSILTSTGLEAKNYRTPTEEAVHKMYLAHIPDAPEDEEKEAEGRKMRQMEDKVRSGHMTAGDVWAKVQKGEITPKEARRTIDRAHKSRLQIEFQSLSLRDAMSVYAKANPLEQAELRPELAHKRELLAELPEADRKPTAEKMNELLAENKPQ